MKYLEENTIKNEIIEDLKGKLYDYEGLSCYSCDLAYTLFEAYNYDGTITYSTNESIKWIKQNFENLGEIIEEIKLSIGVENIPNVFEEPEKFQVIIYLEVASYLMSQCQLINDKWNDKITLDKKTIEIIKKQLEEQKEV